MTSFSQINLFHLLCSTMIYQDVNAMGIHWYCYVTRPLVQNIFTKQFDGHIISLMMSLTCSD